MKNEIEKFTLENGKDVYVKKGWDGYRIVHPIKKDLSKPFFYKNPETKKYENINWQNFLFGGHWSWTLKMLIFIASLYYFVKMYNSDVSICREFIKQINQSYLFKPVISNYSINVSNLINAG